MALPLQVHVLVGGRHDVPQRWVLHWSSAIHEHVAGRPVDERGVPACFAFRWRAIFPHPGCGARLYPPEAFPAALAGSRARPFRWPL